MPVGLKVLNRSNPLRDHQSAFNQLTTTLNALLEAVREEDWLQLETLEPELNIALADLKASSHPAAATEEYRKKLEELLFVQQQVSDRCTNRMKQISPLLEALSATKSVIG